VDRKAEAYDLVVRGGLVVDGSGGEPFEADVGVTAGKIAAVGALGRGGREEIDAKGCIVTPGFVDIHTHYDGQAIWSERLDPSSAHGVTTVVAGNCGVGFAPCRPADHELLVRVMEGVEDIPEIVMTDGLAWEWETFPQFMDAVDRRPHDVDIALQAPHSAVRVYAMGERGARQEPATAADLALMSGLVREAMEAGAIGFSTSRLPIHRTSSGAPIPSIDAAESELAAIADTLGALGRGVLQLVLAMPFADPVAEIELVGRLARRSGRPASFSFAQDNNDPDGWRAAMAALTRANADGPPVRAQVFPRAIGMVLGFDLSVNPFSLCPSWEGLARLPKAQRLAQLRRPETRSRLIEETPRDPILPLALMGRSFERMYPFGAPPDYEPAPQTSIAAQARREGLRPEEVAFDALVASEEAMLYVTLTNYGRGDLGAALELMRHPYSVLGLGDGGAHYGMIADSGYPSFVLTHWVRDRSRGERVPLAWAVKALARDPAMAVGLGDRGLIAPGLKADLNVIDADRLSLRAPFIAHDLPAGGRRMLQKAQSYRATVVSGAITQREDAPTGALPGRVVRAF
jgi:N-acyl-D-aspartate/D-glutamate deacylase